MTPKAIWVDPPFAPLDPEERILGEAGIEFVFSPCESEEEVIQVAREADALMVVLHNYISRRILESLAQCKVVVRHGIGLDNIDVRAATDLGILVSNNPTYCVDEVSDLAMALLLACTRKIPLLNQAVHSGTWQTSMAKTGYRLRGRTLGLLGLGRVARRVAQKAGGFGLRLLAYDPYVSADVASGLGVTLVPLAELLKEADFMSIHTPLTPETRHLIGEIELRLMKPTAYLINTARGDVVEIRALVKALEEKWIAGVGLDVVEGIPPLPQDHPLLRFENAILTPHVAWYSEDATVELQETCARDVVRVLRGELPLSLVDPDVLKQPNCRLPSLQRQSAA
ncbi:MAG: C-terminal binding protein [Anaerolineae bacterium]|nr:C-terminal binding protein [Anaerolineae bacterium]